MSPRRVTVVFSVVLGACTVARVPDTEHFQSRNQRPTPTHKPCTIVATNAGDTAEITAAATIGSDTIEMLRRTTAALDLGKIETQADLRLNGRALLVLSSVAMNDTISVEGTLTPAKGPPVSVKLVRKHGQSNVEGSIDGAAIVPYTAPNPAGSGPVELQIADGRPLPPIELGIDAEKIKKLVSALSDNAQSCARRSQRASLDDTGPPPSNSSIHESRNAKSVPAFSTIVASVKGHDSHTNHDASCVACTWVACEAEALVCNGSIVGNLWELVTDGETCLEQQIACWEDCYHDGGDCCPKVCHDTKASLPFGGYGFFGCCEADESCLRKTGVCCEAGTTPCAGNECCGSGESCNSTTGRCCGAGTTPSGALCCSNATSIPVNGGCCDKGKACGTSCCDNASSCADSTKGLCCPVGAPACNGNCCPAGSTCLGKSCCPAPRVCGSACCGEGQSCQSGKCAAVSCKTGTHACIYDPTKPAICCPHGCCQGKCCDKSEDTCCPDCQDPGWCVK